MRHEADNNQANNGDPDSATALNPYAAPKASLTHHVEGTSNDYVVAKTKFWVLFIGTFSLYGVYWFYRQWDAQKERDGLNIWPIWRAVFSIFFTLSLTKRIDNHLLHNNINYQWTPDAAAWICIVFTVILTFGTNSSLADEYMGLHASTIIAIGSMPILAWSQWHMQAAVNHACFDPKGETNDYFDFANYVWLLVGAILWALVLLDVTGYLPSDAD